MKTRLRKVGNGVGVLLPKSLLKASHLRPNDLVQFRVEGYSIVLQSMKSRRLGLDELVDAITPGNRHGVLDMGLTVGREVM